MNFKIPFFDLDWTLIKGGSLIHKESLVYALKKTFGINTDTNIINIQGMVDSQILYELGLVSGIKKSVLIRNMSKLIKITDEYFLKNYNNEKFSPLPGSIILLKKLKKDKIPIGVLTGNTKVIGRTKLIKSGLYEYIKYEIYGDMNMDRSELVKYALKEVKKDYSDATIKDIVIVGDTVKDIECARENNAKVIALTTGLYDRSDLNGADLILDKLTEIDKFISFIKYD